MRKLTVEEQETVSGGLVSPAFVMALVMGAPDMAVDTAAGAVDTAADLGGGAVDMATDMI